MERIRKLTAVALSTVFLALALPAAASADQAAEHVRRFAADQMEDAHVPGLVFVMVDAEGVLVAEAIGTADLASGRPMTVDTPLRVGSISKPVTAALALELAADGVVDLDDPVDRYLDVDLADRYGPASTLRQLLQHRGGYPDTFIASHHLDPDDALTLDEWVANLEDRAIAPDVVASYSSLDYTLAGVALAGASGTEFAGLAERELFAPLGMVGATFEQPAPPEVATGYGWETDEFEPYPVDQPDLVPGVGLVASAADIGAFMVALLDDRSPLAESTRAGLLTRQGPEPGLRGYTLGLTEWRYGPRTVLYHEGNGIGTTNRMMLLPDEGIGIFTAVNGETLTGMGDPSTQTAFVRDLHRSLIERFFPGEGGVELSAAPQGPRAEGVGGTYLPTRIDPRNVLRVEGLVAQFGVSEVDGGVKFGSTTYLANDEGGYGEGADRLVFVHGADGVYATKGGTAGYRQAAWWETLSVNIAWLGGALVLLVVGITLGIRRTPRVLRWSMLVSAALALGFIGLLGYGILTVDAMDLFTGVPAVIILAQVSAAVLVLASAATALLSTAGRQTVELRPLVAGWMVAVAGFVFGLWAWSWGVLPV